MHIFDLVVEFEEFKAQYLEAANNFDKVTRFWNTFNPDPIGLLNNRQFLHLRDRLFELLRVCKGIDSVAFSKIHKGHPHYFIGITSYLLDDFQTAIYFFDAAFTEDLNSGAHPIANPKPSTRFLMLEGPEKGQSAKVITEITEAKTDRVLNYYQTHITKHANVRN